MELKTLRAFIEVAKLGSFTRAAEQLYLTQPAVSKMVRALEEELGPLLLRDGRSLRLTDAGQVVYEQGQAVLGATARMRDNLDALGQVVRGQLHMGLPPMVGGAFFAPVVRAFRAHYPDVELILTESGALDVERGVLAGEQELGVTVLPAAQEGLESLQFSREDLCLLAPADSRWQGETGVSIAALRDEPLILFNTGFALAERVTAACLEAGFAPRIAARSGQWDFIAELVSARLGVALLPRPLCERLDRTRYVWPPLLQPRILWQLGLIWRRDAYLSHAARAFIAQCRETLCMPGSASGEAQEN